MTVEFALAPVLSASLAGAIFYTRDKHLHVSGSDRHGGPQHRIEESLPRIGGMAAFFGFLVSIWGLCWAGWASLQAAQMATALCLCSLPVVAAGVVEDLSNRVKPSVRLAAAFASSWLAYTFFDVRLSSLHQPFLDQLLMQEAWLAALVTLVALAGLSHAMNIIDGLNGLLGGLCLLAFAGLGWAAHSEGDTMLAPICVIAAGAVLGFLAFNFPRARLLCGDGGAYFLGFLIAAIAVLLVQRNAAISAWFPLLLVAYPVTETLFSIARRLSNGSRVSDSDNSHLHSLVAAKLLVLERAGQRVPLGSNAGAALVCVMLALPSLIGGIAFMHDAQALQWLLAGFITLYMAAFFALSRAAAFSRRQAN
jgi:UDP-GlcNAc:undecaprenyl-phosphate/decaprenyl-phosphate GlcNAc-1-phosphate transferase